MKAKKGLVHNIQDDTYYTSRKISFNKDKDKQLWLLLKYEVGLQKGSIHKLDFSGYKKASPTHLFLDEAGKVIVVMKQRRNPTKYDYQSLIVSKNGNLQASDNIYVYPYYRFKDNFVEGTNWIIPTFRGIALPKGSHQFKISCNGTSIEPDSANEGRSKLIAEINKLVAEIEKAFAEGRDIGNSKSKELQSKRESLGEMPEEAPAKIRRGSESSSESFSVLFAPFGDRLWKMDSPLNTDNKTVDSIGYDVKCVEINPAWKQYELRVGRIENNDKLTAEEKRKALEGMTPPPYCLRSDSTIKYFYEVYTPSGYDPDSEISKLTITDCILEVDGKGMDYSYKDPEAGKGIMYMDWDSDEARQKALDYAIENAGVFMGFPGEGSTWGKSLTLFEDKQSLVNKDPINLWEGPYTELRYETRKVAGEYPNIKEARKHCKTPVHNRGKWICYDYSIVSVCLDNYRFSIVNNRVKTNYDALYCLEVEPEENNVKGNEIVVEVSANGYITETRALAKRDLEASEILFSGNITDKEGTP
ncbi:hypothetical protein KA005_80725, partial [bacterium]|nr:hypothetical protein [bacterium]